MSDLLATPLTIFYLLLIYLSPCKFLLWNFYNFIYFDYVYFVPFIYHVALLLRINMYETETEKLKSSKVQKFKSSKVQKFKKSKVEKLKS